MPDQCQHSGPHGQCHSPSVEGSDNCDRHSNETERIRGYRLTDPVLRKRFEEHGTSTLEQIRQEIQLLRVMAEDRFNLAQSPGERIAAYQFVSNTLVNIVKCQEVVTKLELSNSVVLGKEALASLSEDIILILADELQDVPKYDTIIDAIARRMADAIASKRNET